MTIDAIFTRYDIPEATQHDALLRGAFVLSLRDAWVGPEVTWSLLVKAVIFSSLSDAGPHVRKKVGLDKYIVTLITRGQVAFVDKVVYSHDLHQKLYAYCAWQGTGALEDGQAGEVIKNEIQHNLLDHVAPVTLLSPQVEHTLRSINILHYKNPSV